MGIRILCKELVGRVCDTRCCVSCIWLKKDVLLAEPRELLLHEITVFLCCDHDDVFLRNDPAASVVSLLDEGLACAGNIKELFRLCGSADRPESCS